MSAIERKLQILTMIPRLPNKIGRSAIEDKLIDLGFDIDKRTVQRDMHDLSRLFPIVDDGRKPLGWSWTKDAEPFDLPRMDPIAALTFKMTEDFLSSLLPPATYRALSPHFNQASQVLLSMKGNTFQSWPDKIRILSRSQHLSAPHVDEGMIDTVYSSLLEGKRFTALYKGRGKKEPSEYDVNPLGIVVLDSILYLVCTMKEYMDIRQLSIHRIISAKKLETPSFIPEGFTLQQYIDSGAFDYLQSEQVISLKAVFNKDIAAHLYETPLSDNQVITEMENDMVMIEASVLDTSQLRWWLLGFGEKVEVIEPKTLREEFTIRAEKIYSQYCKRH